MMKRIISLVLLASILAASVLVFTACDGGNECFICGGTGYYQKKDCPGCP